MTGNRVAHAVRRIARYLAGAGVLFILAEGTASLALGFWDYHRAEPPPVVRPVSMRDTLLGWVGRPRAVNPNEYGPGIGVVNNSRGFRGAREVDSLVPPGRVRVICSGDSYTQGYGVADSESWCARLEEERPQLETVNMGMPGYGIDQAYLWYLRDGRRQLQHQIHLLGIFHRDFERMATTEMVGVPKPMLELRGDSLLVVGTPVPPVSRPHLRRVYGVRELRRLRIVELLAALGPGEGRERLGSKIYSLVEAIMAQLGRIDRRENRQFAVVYLPGQGDLEPGRLDGRREWLRAAGQRAGVRVIDLTPALRAEPPQVQDRAFIAYSPPGSAPGINGHYSMAGHAWVARQLAPILDSMLGARTTRVAAPE